MKAGLIFTYKIIDNTRQPAESPEAAMFLNYLETFEIDSRFRAELERKTLSTPMISLPVSRSSSGLDDSVSLADFNEYDLKRSVDAASSRTPGSIISLAIGRLAERFRNLLELADGRTEEVFYADPSVVSFTKNLKLLGYDWKLECTNTKRNKYDVRLTKQGASFLVNAASSGEKELLIYLFAIYALNVRDALIVIDEPELHLHPRWQRTLLGLFETLSKDTGNQFVMATHSPVFVSPSSIQYVSRVSSENQSSKIVRLGDSNLPETKHLFSIVNSQNNEKLFFCDKVILVEGVSDRIFFEALLKHFSAGATDGLIYEVIGVGGKSFFEPYTQLLKACRIPFGVIADLDYVSDVGDGPLKSLFTIKSRDLKENVIDDATSIDGQTLLARMDEALKTGNLEDLKVLWEYIKARQRRLKEGMTPTEQKLLDDFIAKKRSEQVAILSRGPLERYLPAGHAQPSRRGHVRIRDKSPFPSLYFGESAPLVAAHLTGDLSHGAQTTTRVSGCLLPRDQSRELPPRLVRESRAEGVMSGFEKGAERVRPLLVTRPPPDPISGPCVT